VFSVLQLSITNHNAAGVEKEILLLLKLKKLNPKPRCLCRIEEAATETALFVRSSFAGIPLSGIWV
jgi:hypothetical protein